MMDTWKRLGSFLYGGAETNIFSGFVPALASLSACHANTASRS
jgi:hypothetical protein